MNDYKILFSDEFKSDLGEIIQFIAQDNYNRALNFRDNLIAEISRIGEMPYRFRKNKTMNQENIRDLIYKKYIIPFLIKKDEIIILAIFKNNKSKFSIS